MDSIEVYVLDPPPPFELGDDIFLCPGDEIEIAFDPGLGDFLWQDGSSSPTFTVTTPGTYTLAESNRCGVASDTITVAYQDTPDPFSLGPDTTMCSKESILLSAPSSFYDVLWQDGSGMLHLIVDRPGTYSLQLSNECGLAKDEIKVSVDRQTP